MFYTIGQISKKTGIPISTLRYYDREGMFPSMERSSGGIRVFSDREIGVLRVIECLKKTGMEIKDIKEFMMWCQQGPATYGKRKEMFIKQKETVEAEIEHLKKVLDMITYKCWYYDTAIADGNEDRLKNLSPDDMPPEIKAAWINAHT